MPALTGRMSTVVERWFSKAEAKSYLACEKQGQKRAYSSPNCGLFVKLVKSPMSEEEKCLQNVYRKSKNLTNKRGGRPVAFAELPAIRKAGPLHPLTQLVWG